MQTLGRFDKTDKFTLVRIDLLNGDRKSLKALAAEQRTNHGPLIQSGAKRCRDCGLKVRGVNHESGQDHIRGKGRK